MNTYQKPVERGDEIEVTIESTGAKGDGIAKVNNFVIIVPGAKEGDKVKVRITRVLKKMAFAEVITEGSSSEASSEEEESVASSESDEDKESYAQEELSDEEKKKKPKKKIKKKKRKKKNKKKKVFYNFFFLFFSFVVT